MTSENNDGYQPGEYVGDSGDYANDERFNEEQTLIEEQSHARFRESIEDEDTLDRELDAEEPDFDRELEEEDDEYGAEDDEEGVVDAESEIDLDSIDEPEDSYDRLIGNSRVEEPEDTGNAWHKDTRAYGEGTIREVNVDEDRFEKDDVWGDTGDDR